ncbi:MAG: glycosyltransferase family 39 protein, partial [Lentisphaeria bacterium]|nr:glycosyltransferase family 39 protein [Lentisphaeria bacterium]
MLTKSKQFWQSLRFSERFLILFLLFSALFWVLVPALSWNALPYDPAETLMWGSTFNWGSSKHPPLAGIMLFHFCRLFSFQDFSVFLLSQICMTLGFLFLWKLARCFLDRDKSVMATLLITFYFFYNYETPKFCANTPHLLFIPMMCYFFYRGTERNLLKDWLLLAFEGACACLSKYSSSVLFLAFLLYLLLDKEARKCLRTPGPYLAGAVFFLLLSPHILHLFRTHGLVFHYISEGKTPGWGYFTQIFAMAGALLVPLACMGFAAYLSFALGRKSFLPFRNGHAPGSVKGVKYVSILLGTQAAFLLLMGIAGNRLELIWTYPVFLPAGILILSLIPTSPDPRSMRIFAFLAVLWGVFLLVLMLVQGNFISKYRCHLDKNLLREEAEKFYREKTGRKLVFVSGKIWESSLVQNAASYRIEAAPMADPILLSLHENVIRGK